MAAALLKGTVREFHTARGRGVILTEQGDCVQVRYSAIVGEGVRRLNCGDRVFFELEQTGKGTQAIRVTRA